VGASIGVDRVIALPTYNAPMPKIIKKSKIYFIQLGFEAKLRSLEVIEILRKARIPVLHSLNKDSLSIQLGNAERLGLPYSLILGQKEALDRTVIIRNMENRSQETVKISDLAEYIKEHKIG
jgi:histidyl-tRNA synthetase